MIRVAPYAAAALLIAFAASRIHDAGADSVRAEWAAAAAAEQARVAAVMREVETLRAERDAAVLSARRAAAAARGTASMPMTDAQRDAVEAIR